MNQLIAAFEAYFRVINADTPQLLREVFRLRYQVYCEDTHLADGVLFPERLESDQYDQRSTHILLQHRPSGNFVGTMRIVLPDHSALRKPFPVEELARFDSGFPGVPSELRRHVAEISRFAVLHRFPHHKARRFERPLEPAAADEALLKPRLRFPHPIVALLFGVMRTSTANNITHWYAAMTPSLDRLLSHFGLNLQVIGPAFDLHGERRPHFDSINNVMNRAYHHRPDVWELITDCGRLWPAALTPQNSLSESAVVE